MKEIINPNFKIKDGDSLFNLRERDFANLLPNVREILRPLEDDDFKIVDLDLKDSYSIDIERTLYKLLVIKLERDEQKLDLSLKIPKIVDKNFVVIGGKKKIPLFQLFDLPFVTTKDGIIKIRTNIATFNITKSKDSPFVFMRVLGADVPLFILLLALNEDRDDLIKEYDLDSIPDLSDVDGDDMESANLTVYDALRYDLKKYIDYFGPKSREELAEIITSFYKKKPFGKGESILYALNIITKVDPMTSKFFRTDNIISEAVDIIRRVSSGEIIDDTDLQNKRLRCMEYMVLRIVAKAVFDLCMISRTESAKTKKKKGKKSIVKGKAVISKSSDERKFKINSSHIISECSVSDVVQFDTSINPIENITSILRCTYLGKDSGGFDRSSIPTRLRDINPSMFGRICPVETPDRENCGVVQSLIPNVEVDENYRFTENVCDKQPVSVAVSMVPFLEKDDQTRLQMAASQMRQAINLQTFEPALIQSGCEGIYSDYTYFVKKAKKDGEVVYLDSEMLIVIYNDKTSDVFEVGIRNTYTENIDIPNIYVTVGDRFRSGDILAESNFCTDGKINIGRNLLTAIMPYYGYNYEDAIVISDKLEKENILTSVHHINLGYILPADKVLLSLDKNIYKPLPSPKPYIELDEPGKSRDYYNSKKVELIRHGNPYSILKEIQDDPLLFTNNFEEPTMLLAKRDILITKVEIYPNNYNRSVAQFKDWVERKFEAQLARQDRIQDIIKSHLPRDDANRYIKDKSLDRFSMAGKFKVKDDVIKGMYVAIKGMFLRKISVGDKIGNRHGNKGVICTIVPHEKMPQLPDGRHADIVINPLGTISRMNIGQIFELHLGMSLADLKKNLFEMLRKKTTQKEMKKYVLEYIKIIDNTSDKWYTTQVEDMFKGYKTHIDEEFIENLYLLAPPFESSSYEQIHEACKYTNTPLEYKIYDPVSDKEIINPQGVGMMYFFRMIHIAESKISARGIGSYSKKTLQPPGGRRNHGGQRCGEMETFCFAAHDGMKNLTEILTTKSDCMGQKNKFLREALGSEYIKDVQEEDMTPESVKLMEAYLKTVGIDL